MKLSAIKFNTKFKGRGIVNYDMTYDDNIRLPRLKDTPVPFYITDSGKKVYSTIKCAKRELYKTDVEGVHDYKINVSNACVLESMYSKAPRQRENLIIHEMKVDSRYFRDLSRQIVTEKDLTHGYMYAFKQNKVDCTINRRHSITLPHLVQTCNAKSSFTIGTSNITKDKKAKTDNEKNGSTSLFYTETIGNISYVSPNGLINLNEMQFVSGDDFTGRKAYLDFSKYKEQLLEHYAFLGLDESEIFEGLYTFEGDVMTRVERGIKLPKKLVDYLVKDFLKRLILLDKRTKSSFLNTEEIEIEFVDNNGESIGQVFITQENKDMIDSLEFEYNDFYLLQSTLAEETV